MRIQSIRHTKKSAKKGNSELNPLLDNEKKYPASSYWRGFRL